MATPQLEADVPSTLANPLYQCDWTELRRSPPPATAIEVVDARTADLSARQSPAVVEGLAVDWPASHKWASAEALRRHYGDVVFELPKHPDKEVALSAFLDYTDTNTADSPCYLVERAFEGERSALLDDFTVPPMFADDLLGLVPGSRRARYWFVGGARTGTFLHVDPLCTSAWNTCTLGLKRWCFLPPETDLAALGLEHWTEGKFQKPGAFFLHEYPVLQAASAAGNVKMVECVQRAGDTVFVPVRAPRPPPLDAARL